MERLNHHHLYLFWLLAKQGTFTKTAEFLRIAQSAVTSQIRALEDSLGMVLIDRSNRRKPTLTLEGRKLLEFADSIFETSAELLKWAKQGEPTKVQSLRVGALSGLSRNLQYEFLKPLVGDPSSRIEILTGDQEKLVRLLKEHSLDVILSSHNVAAEGRALFHSHVLTRSPLVFVSRSRLGRNRSLKEHLQELPVYIPGPSFEARPELNAYLDAIQGIKIAGEIDDVALLRIFALRSGAVVALPEMGVRNDIEERSLQVLGTAGRVEQKFYAITRQRKFPSPLLAKLIETIREEKA